MIDDLGAVSIVPGDFAFLSHNATDGMLVYYHPSGLDA